MNFKEKNRGGLVLGTLFAAAHATWVVIVWSGAGKGVLGALHRYHFVTNPYEMVAVEPGTALVGIVGAFVAGYALGFITLFLWDVSG